MRTPSSFTTKRLQNNLCWNFNAFGRLRMTDPLKLLAVFAHPDDESMGMGGALARYSAEGSGDVPRLRDARGKGLVGVRRDPTRASNGVGEIRTQELENAGRVLGLKEIHFLNYIDGDLDQADHEEASGKSSRTFEKSSRRWS